MSATHYSSRITRLRFPCEDENSTSKSGSLAARLTPASDLSPFCPLPESTFSDALLHVSQYCFMYLFHIDQLIPCIFIQSFNKHSSEHKESTCLPSRALYSNARRQTKTISAPHRCDASVVISLRGKESWGGGALDTWSSRKVTSEQGPAGALSAACSCLQSYVQGPFGGFTHRSPLSFSRIIQGRVPLWSFNHFLHWWPSLISLSSKQSCKQQLRQLASCIRGRLLQNTGA